LSKVSQFASRRKLIVQDPNAVTVENLDRAILEIIGQERFVANLQSRKIRHAEAVMASAQQDTDAAKLVRLAMEQHNAWGYYEKPYHGIEIRRQRALFRFVRATMGNNPSFDYKCTVPSPLWHPGDVITIDVYGAVLGIMRA
jgi:hypothetical protein